MEINKLLCYTMQGNWKFLFLLKLIIHLMLSAVEHEVLEREIGRLRALYQQHQQQPPPPSSTHRRSNSRDLDSQFANLSLKTKDASSGTLHIWKYGEATELCPALTLSQLMSAVHIQSRYPLFPASLLVSPFVFCSCFSFSSYLPIFLFSGSRATSTYVFLANVPRR